MPQPANTTLVRVFAILNLRHARASSLWRLRNDVDVILDASTTQKAGTLALPPYRSVQNADLLGSFLSRRRVYTSHGRSRQRLKVARMLLDGGFARLTSVAPPASLGYTEDRGARGPRVEFRLRLLSFSFVFTFSSFHDSHEYGDFAKYLIKLIVNTELQRRLDCNWPWRGLQGYAGNIFGLCYVQ